MEVIKSNGNSDFDEAISKISDLNIIPLSFYVLGFSYLDISSYICVSEKIVKKESIVRKRKYWRSILLLTHLYRIVTRPGKYIFSLRMFTNI
jgi:hypothetical protein